MSQIDKSHPLSVSRQCEVLDVPRGSFYYSPREEGSYNEELMELIDKQHMDTPFYGVPRMTEYLRGLGHNVNPKRVRRLYRQMDLYGMDPRPNTGKPHKGKGHTVHPYLPWGLRVDRVNQVWAMELYQKIKDYMEFYNRKRPHQTLGYKTPEEMFRETNLSDSNNCLRKGRSLISLLEYYVKKR